MVRFDSSHMRRDKLIYMSGKIAPSFLMANNIGSNIKMETKQVSVKLLADAGTLSSVGCATQGRPGLERTLGVESFFIGRHLMQLVEPLVIAPSVIKLASSGLG